MVLVSLLGTLLQVHLRSDTELHLVCMALAHSRGEAHLLAHGPRLQVVVLAAHHVLLHMDLLREVLAISLLGETRHSRLFFLTVLAYLAFIVNLVILLRLRSFEKYSALLNFGSIRVDYLGLSFLSYLTQRQGFGLELVSI